MLGTSEERRFFEPTGSQTHSSIQETSSILPLSAHPNTTNNAVAAAAVAAKGTASTAIFPSLFPPSLSNLSHLSAHPTLFGANSLNAIDIALNRTHNTTPNIWPGGSPTLLTTSGQLANASSNAVSSGRFSAFNLHPSNQGELGI